MNERAIFDAALETADPQARRAFVEKACAGNPGLLVAVESLLKSHDAAGSFLDIPVAEQMGKIPSGVAPANPENWSAAVDKTRLSQAGDADDDDSDDERQPDLSFLKPSSKPGSIGVLAHYEVLSVLGQGAFGMVFKAFDEKLRRLVAIKVMNPQMASTSPPRKRFLREARSAAAIKHENVVQVYSVEEQPLPYLVMEFIDGQTLKQKLDSSGPLETPEVLHIARQIASGLAAAQAMGLIHRDIKPGNILLEGAVAELARVRTDGEPDRILANSATPSAIRVKISDFGLARAADDASLTRTGVISGTPMYMAPEQALGQSLDHRADLFSLGSVLYQMSCGRPPFRAATTIAVLRRVVEDTPRPLQEILPEIPDWLVAIVTKLLAKKPEDRFQTAKEVADLLTRCQSELQLNGKVTCVTIPKQEDDERVARPESSKGVESQSTTPFAKPQGVPPDRRSPLPGESTQAKGDLRSSDSAGSGDPRTARTAGAVARWLIAGVIGIAALAAAIVFQRANHTKSEISNLKSQISNPPGQAESTDSTNPDRRAAEYVLLIGGTITIKENGEERGINAGRDLPDGAFELTQVSLSHSPKVSDAGLAHFKDCKNLTILDLSGTKVTDAGLAHFKNCKNLRYLELRYAQVTDAGLAHFKNCKNLTRLGLQDARLVTGAGLAHFKDCKNLELLMLNSCAKMSDAGMADFKDCKSLTDLYLGDCSLVTDAMLAHFKDCKNLSLLHLGYTQVTDAGLAHFKNCKNLVQLNLTATKVSDAGLVNFKDCKNLQHLHLSVTQVTDVGLVHFKDCANLTALSLNATQVSDAGLAHFKDCRNLTILNLWTTAVSDVSLERLADDPKLIFVDVRKTKVTEAGMKKLSAALPGCKIEWDGGVIEPRTGWHGWSADAPPPAIAPFDAEQAKQHQAAWAKYLGVPVEYTNSLGMKFRLIPPGEFMMGSTAAEIEEALKFAGEHKDWQEFIQSEAPQHKVILTRPIYLGVHEVTQSQYEQVMGKNPSYFAATGPVKEASDKVAGMDTTNHPVEVVSWNDAADFCTKRSQQEKLKPFYFRADQTVTMLDGTGYRLPTEAEWEFSCRAGTTTKYWSGDQGGNLAATDWIGTNSDQRTHSVGELKANPFGLFDVHGNIREWVQDWWEPNYYGQFQGNPALNPSGPSHGGSLRVSRGGQWGHPVSYCRASFRYAATPEHTGIWDGFRVALPVDAVRQALKVDGAKSVKLGVPVGANGNPVAEQGRSAWDDLDPAQIPEAERVPRQPEGLVAVLGQHRRRVWNRITSSSVSPDGTQFTLTTDDGLHLFGRDPKQPARFFNQGAGAFEDGRANYTSATFLPDGRIAAFVHELRSTEVELQVFGKPRDGSPLEKQMATTTDGGATMATASSDGHWLAAFGDNDSLGLWRLGDAPPQRVAKFALPTPHGNISPGSFSPDAHWFCFTDNSNVQSAVHLIDLRGDTPREATVLKADADEKTEAPAKGFEHAAFLSDGRLATADRNGRTWFWKINDGEPQRVGSITDTGLLFAAAQSLRLAVCHVSGYPFRVWDLAVDPPQLLGHASSSSFSSDNVSTLAVAPNGETILTGHLNGAVRHWSVSQTGVNELDPLVPNPRNTFHGRMKVVDRFLCASTESSRVGIWRPTRDGLQAVPDATPSVWVLDAAKAQVPLIVAGPGAAGGTTLLRCDADRVTLTRRITGDKVGSAALNDQGRRLAIGRHNGTDFVLELWGWESDDLPAKKLFETKSSPDHVIQLAFAEAGRALVGRVGFGFHIQIWDVTDDQLVARTKLPPRQCYQFAVAPDGQTLATASYSVGVELWNLKSDLTKPTTSFAISGTGAVAFSPDGRRLAASFWENGASAGVQIINLASGVVEKRLTFPGRVHELTFTDDSRHLITGNANATIYVVRLQGPPTK